MMLNNWVQQLLADIERLTLGYESVILAVTVLIGLVTIIFFIVVWSYVDPYEKAINELQTQNRQYPLASLFVAVRNDEKLILDCVESMIGQTYKKREIFVIDDASEDNTANILRENFEDNPEVKVLVERLEEEYDARRARWSGRSQQPSSDLPDSVQTPLPPSVEELLKELGEQDS